MVATESKSIFLLFFVLSIALAGCEEPATTYTSMDRSITGTISPADLIDQVTFFGQGVKRSVVITFDPAWFRCKRDAPLPEFQKDMLINVRDSTKDPLFLVDSFSSPRTWATKTGPGAEYFEKFKLESGTILQLVEGPYCYGKSTWWFAVTRDKTSPYDNAYLFGLIPESRDGVGLLEIYERDDQ